MRETRESLGVEKRDDRLPGFEIPALFDHEQMLLEGIFFGNDVELESAIGIDALIQDLDPGVGQFDYPRLGNQSQIDLGVSAGLQSDKIGERVSLGADGQESAGIAGSHGIDAAKS